MKKTTYKELLNQHETYNGSDYLCEDERKELYHDVKQRAGEMLPGSNYRATIRPNGNGEIILTSYYTDVFSYNVLTGEMKKLWNGYSATTMKHINMFCKKYGLKGFTKKEWIEF